MCDKKVYDKERKRFFILAPCLSDLISQQINLFDIKTLTHALNSIVYYDEFMVCGKEEEGEIVVSQYTFLMFSMTTMTFIRMAFNTNVQFNKIVPHSSL